MTPDDLVLDRVFHTPKMLKFLLKPKDYYGIKSGNKKGPDG